MFTASDVLLKAASRIEEEGMWCQGRFFAESKVVAVPGAFSWRENNTTRMAECAVGALISSTIELGLTFHDFEDAQFLFDLRVLAYKDFNPWNSTIWNDAPGRTAHEVARSDAAGSVLMPRLSVPVVLPTPPEPTRSMMKRFIGINDYHTAITVRCTVCGAYGRISPKLKKQLGRVVCGGCK